MPNRLIKETIRTRKRINSLSDFEFRAWTYLITYVDDYGRGSADPELLKGFVFPRRKEVREQDIQGRSPRWNALVAFFSMRLQGNPIFSFQTGASTRGYRRRSRNTPLRRMMICHGGPRLITVYHRLNPNPIRIQNLNPIRKIIALSRKRLARRR